MKKNKYLWLVMTIAILHTTTAHAYVSEWSWSWTANSGSTDFYEVCWGQTLDLEESCDSTTTTNITLFYLFNENTRYFFGVRACCGPNNEFGNFSKTATRIETYPHTIVSAASDYDGDHIIDRAFRTSEYQLMIDYSGTFGNETGFNAPGTWDVILPRYGGLTAHMVQIDYNQGGKEDIVYIKSNGTLRIDLSEDGLGETAEEIIGYFVYDGEYQIFAADHDGDMIADISINTKNWQQFIDYGHDGYGNLIEISGTFGGALATFFPIDYDQDGSDDICIISGNGTLSVALASTGFSFYNYVIPNYVTDAENPVEIKILLADHDGDNQKDISIMQPDWSYHIDYAADGYGNAIQMNGTYGGGAAMPILIDEDRDGRYDIGILKGNGELKVDFAVDGFNGFNKTLLFH